MHYTWNEYLALESASNVKHEYLDGQIYAMAGGTPAHAALQATIPALIFPQIRAGRCRAHGADLRVRVLATGLATYPDVTIVYVLVSTDQRRIEVWTRDADGAWADAISTDGEVADLASIGARIDVRELYEAAAESGA